MGARRSAEVGLSLIEVLVATAVLSVTVIVALTVYDASRKAFAKSENATEQQESVRIAFDTLTTNLRMLGYNVNPDGNPNRPDEQLEGALDHAVILRADFDRSDAAASVNPESTLAGGAFSTVSTGNDEIVAYVLAKPDGTGPDTLTFQADVREAPRDGAVETVTIGNVVLAPTSPPYTLYRVTLNNDPRSYGTSGFVVRTPVAENVRNLSFTYFGESGTFKDPSASIPETSAAKATRSGLARVNVSLIGMTRQQDLAYNDPSDAAAPHHRKFELVDDVTPRNMRLKGIMDFNADVTPPSKPATPTLVPGHCGGLLASWMPNPIGDGVVSYRISWGLGSGAVSGSRNVPGAPYFLDGITTDATYVVSVQAQDAQGNLSPRSDWASAIVKNLNRPSAPSGLTTSTNQTYHVAVAFTPVTTNTANIPAADPLAPKVRDLAGYRLYRSYGGDGPWDDHDKTVLGPSDSIPYLDTPLVACKDWYYRMTAVDTCGKESDPSPVSLGRVANAGVKPESPQNVQAHYIGPGTAQVKWSRIVADVAGFAIKIERYEVYRSRPVDGGRLPLPADWGPDPLEVWYDNDYTDRAVPHLDNGQVVYYRVRGGDYCDNDSDFSAEAKLECAFSGDVDFITPANGDIVSGTVPVTVAVTGGTDTYVSVSITYVHSANGRQRTFTSATSATRWTDPDWHAVPLGAYTITATVTAMNESLCTETGTIEVTATNPPAGPP